MMDLGQSTTMLVASHATKTGGGGSSQTRELRAGNLVNGVFVEPPGNQNRSLVQLRALSPVIQETLSLPGIANQGVRAFRTSLNLIGDGFVEAIDSNVLNANRLNQPAGFQGTLIQVPVVEAGGAARAGRFGIKNQHSSLVSFSGDAYLNEMGITNIFDGSGGNSENNSLVDRSPPSIPSRTRKTMALTRRLSPNSLGSSGRRAAARSRPPSLAARLCLGLLGARSVTRPRLTPLLPVRRSTRARSSFRRLSATRASARSATSCCTTSERATGSSRTAARAPGTWCALPRSGASACGQS